ncbi:MAG: 7-carboxy-7-deazaguanine synthase QueE [Candidatus Hydrothermarchaeales archaeon]
MKNEHSGYLAEIFSSYQGEGGSVEGSCSGKRQIFLRFAGCNLALKELGTSGCIWCDTPEARMPRRREFRVEVTPGERDFGLHKNPASVGEVLVIIDMLKTRDLHSISFTGGEPLYQGEFVIQLAKELKKAGYGLYLETNGSIHDTPSDITSLFDYACVDIKDESSRAAKDWKLLVENEFKMIKLLKDGDVKVFGKVVVTGETRSENIEWYAKELRDMGVALAIQVATPYGPVKATPQRKIFELTEAAAKYLGPDMITFSFQSHKMMGVL